MPSEACDVRLPTHEDVLWNSKNEEACRILGVDGSIEAQVDLGFLQDPLDWIASDIASSIQSVEAEDEDEDAGGLTLTALVAELRLRRALAGEIDEARLVEAVKRHLEADG